MHQTDTIWELNHYEGGKKLLQKFVIFPKEKKNLGENKNMFNNQFLMLNIFFL